MANEVKVNATGWNSGLDKLAGPIKEQIARRMAVGGGQVLRDAARENARVPYTGGREKPLKGNSTWVYNPAGSSNSSDSPGSLADAIYLARDESKTTEKNYTYRISWNNHYAWWGRLREFGYYIRYAFTKNPETGMYATIHPLRELPTPIRIPPNPFLAPAYDQNIDRAHKRMLEKGKEAVLALIPGSRS